MRIATSTIYSQQTTAIDNQEALYTSVAAQLSSGISFTVPSDDPAVVGQDLAVRTTIATENQSSTNVTSAVNQLTTTDSALANLTSVLQSVRSLAVEGADGTLSTANLQDIATEVNQYLEQTVSIANTQSGGTYLFAGTADVTSAPVTTEGDPINSVSFSGNQDTQSLDYNGQSYALSTTLQQAFNYNSADGSPSVFQVLQTLASTLQNGTVTDESASAVNNGTGVIYGAGSPAPTTLGDAPLATALTPDSSGQYSIAINNTDANGVVHSESYTFGAGTAIDDGTPASVVGQINANSATTGLTASFDTQTQKLILTSSGGGSFSVTDTASAGATNTGNFVEAFGLQGQADVTSTLSTQLNDIDNVTNVALNARAAIGSQIDSLNAISGQLSTQITDNTNVQSGIEDTNIASATSQFTAAETALQAAFATTSRLEGKTLFDYLG
jgi:flagellar hook-associated protein 3 FlgL